MQTEFWRDRQNGEEGGKPLDPLDMAVAARGISHKPPWMDVPDPDAEQGSWPTARRPIFTIPLQVAIIYGAQFSQQSANQVLQGHSAGGDGDDDDETMMRWC
ncbi:hypothetical protein BDDG_08056 [Blastomyces dermatitidis ATCC 18188]|uniref:Uncharacterized protein n=1 Tax=Ajellomyces dermatitidis (strain ATCC 18188 / CBS 674.68) TaxID=653446 RepID=F2TPE8_AJEDA|nr:hypothetical protein BDDG_08056 [Blastomyces dermatitidis ATCC 18188]